MTEKLKQTVSGFYNNFVLHWKTPPLGKYVTYKESVLYGLGGMGIQFVIVFCAYIALSANSFLIGNTIGIKPMDLQLMSIPSTFIGFAITIVRSYIIDNSRLKMGKFRPWLAIMGIPSVIIAFVFVWLPFETMSYSQKCAAVFICFNLLQCFFPFYQNSYTDLANVISPNSYERTDIVSVSSIIYSLAPSITGMFVPLLVKLTGGYTNIQSYRIIFPIISTLGVLISYIAVFGTKERLIIAKTHVSQFKFIDAFRSVSKNKYFWITSLAGWLGFLEGAVGVIIGWTFMYGYPDRMGLYGIITTIIGNASLWSMLICPLAIRTIGKRNLLIVGNLANVLVISLLFFTYKSIPMIVILYYLNTFVSQFAIVYNPGINADMRDYQQYYTGERIDGMFGAVGIIGSFIGMFTGLVLPAIYQNLGLRDNYNVLEVGSFREDMFETLIAAATIGALLNVIPFFFYDLTEQKQRGIVKVLKIRALFEDYGNGILRDSDLVEAIDIIDEANRLYEYRKNLTTKDDIKRAKQLPARTAEEKRIRKEAVAKAKRDCKTCQVEYKKELSQIVSAAKALPKGTKEEKLTRKQALKAAHAEKKQLRRMNSDISVCDFVVDEMNKFDTARIKAKLERYRALERSGEAAIRSYDGSMKKQAKALPRDTFENRQIRSDAMALARQIKDCQKYMNRYYKDKPVNKPDPAAFERAEAMPEETAAESRLKKKTLKALVNEQSHYNRAMKVLLDAERHITEEKNYSHLEEIRQHYEESKVVAEAEALAHKQKLEQLENERKADIERRKQERLVKKGKGQ